MLPRIRALACVAAVVLPACVIKLTDRNSPDENGGVTGPSADCSKVTVPPGGAPGGEAAPKYVGRFWSPGGAGEPQAPSFDWSGSYITVRFQGTDHVTVKLQPTGVKVKDVLIAQDQMFVFAVDDFTPSLRQVTSKKDAAGEYTNEPLEDYEIVGLAKNAPHELTIYKNTEAQKGSIVFKGVDLHGGTYLPPTRRARRIEFIGDSIICGYGDEGKNATCPFEVKVRDVKDSSGNPIIGPDGKPMVVTVPRTENQYLAFTALAARELDADAVTICWSGKGVYLNYKENRIIDPVTHQEEDDPDAKTTVPDLWETRILGNDPIGAQTPLAEGGNRWDFTLEKPEEVPQVVVISLGTNDFARDNEPRKPAGQLSGDNVPDGNMNDPAEREKFYEKYLELVKKVRKYRPQAHIFLATPPMLTDQFPLDNARSHLREALLRIVHDMESVGGKVYQMDLVEQGFRYGLGCDYHPNLDVHKIMARQLVGAIKSKTCWSR